MRCILGEVHRQKILSFIKPDTRLLEWGSGGSTVWFAENIDVTVKFTSVERNPYWFNIVNKQIGNRPNVRLLLKEAKGTVGQNATIEEEDPKPVIDFIHAVDNEHFEVIFVDGNARCACMYQAQQLLTDTGIIILHDAQRNWYDTAKLIYYTHGNLGPCVDYPKAELWWGAKFKTIDEMQTLI